MNDLYEFGGACDVIIRCNSDRTIGGVEYKAGQPYTLLEDVYVQINYVNTSSNSNARMNVLSRREGLPDNISIMNVPLTEKVCNLVTTKINAKRITKTCKAEAIDGRIYLPEPVLQDTLYVYKGNKLLEGYTVDTTNNMLVGDFESGKYLIFYEVLSSDSCFDFTTPHYGYFCVEVWGKGNEDKTSTDLYIKLPACSLVTNGVFDLVRGNILNAPLVFTCIHQQQEMPYFSIE